MLSYSPQRQIDIFCFSWLFSMKHFQCLIKKDLFYKVICCTNLKYVLWKIGFSISYFIGFLIGALPYFYYYYYINYEKMYYNIWINWLQSK